MLAAVLVLGCGLAAPAPAGACGSKAYSYAGLVDGGAAHGIQTTITALAPLDVEWGHVGGWVGVDGRDRYGRLGWIQVGIAVFYGGESRLYYEFKRGDDRPAFVELAGSVPVGEPHRIAVREQPTRPSWWRVWVDGRPVSPAIRLPGSHGRWKAVATAESWNAGMGACNAMRFRFDGVNVQREDGRWGALARPTVLQDPGYAVRDRTRTGFVAGSA